jgi:atypical dual specificity phosphatase
MPEKDKLKVCIYRERTDGYIVAFSDGSRPVFCHDMQEVCAEFQARAAEFFDEEPMESVEETGFEFDDPDAPTFSPREYPTSVNTGKARHEGVDLTEFGKEIPCLANIFAMRDPRRSLTSVDGWVKLLLEAGINQLVNLTEEDYSEKLRTKLLESNIDYSFVPVKDFECPTREQVGKIVLWAKDTAKKTVIHCGAGKGRTGTVVSCIYATRDKDADSNFIIEAVRDARSGSVETQEQEKFVGDYIVFVDSLREPSKVDVPKTDPAQK